jgi:hypothetical protein
MSANEKQLNIDRAQFAPDAIYVINKARLGLLKPFLDSRSLPLMKL